MNDLLLTNNDCEIQVRKTFNKYYSTNEELIYGLNEINESVIIEPFAGNCDLILQTSKLFRNKPLIKAYDITEIKAMNLNNSLFNTIQTQTLF